MEYTRHDYIFNSSVNIGVQEGVEEAAEEDAEEDMSGASYLPGTDNER